MERWRTVVEWARELTGREGRKGCWKSLDRQVESPEKGFLNSTRTDFASRQVFFFSFLLSTPRFVLPKKWEQTVYKKYSKTLLV